VKIPHDRVTVNRIRNAECGMRIEKSKIQNPKSKIESRATCPERFVSWMFREKASAANTVFY
jgi:hypothetical protein